MSKKYVFTIKNWYRILKHQAGFSLIEIVVAMGIMSVVAGLFATSVVQLQKSQVSFEDKNASFAFVSSLTGSILGDQQTCTHLLKGTRLTNNASEFTVANFSGLGSKTIDLKKNTVISGSDNNQPKVRIRSLTIQAKPNIQTTKIRANGVDYDRMIAEIILSTETRQPGASATKYTAEPNRTIDVPVYVRNGIIETCQINMTRVDVCNTIGAGIDPNNTSRCLPQEQCFVKGSYFISKCEPEYNGCVKSVANPITGGLNCPERSTATSTGMYSQTYNVSCGKKCSYTVKNTIEYFMCMQCN